MSLDPARLESAPNFRDLGGHWTRDRRRVRRGVVYRSELLDRLSAQDLDHLATLGIRVVCDLRHGEERSRRQNRWPEGAELRSIGEAPTEGLEAVQPDNLMRRLVAPDFEPQEAMAVLQQAYARMPYTLAPQLRAVCGHLISPDCEPLLIHCTSGKDRSGFIAAALLAALGVAMEDIMEDYMLSKRHTPLDLIRGNLKGALGDDLSEARLNVLVDLATVHPSYLSAAFSEITAQFGNFDSYLHDYIRLDERQHRVLQMRLLEPH